METPSSAEQIAISGCFSGGIRSVKFPLNFFRPSGSGTGSFSPLSHLIVSARRTRSLAGIFYSVPLGGQGDNFKHLATCP